MAQKFLGLPFDRQTLMMAGGAIVAAFALSGLFRSRDPLAVAAAPAFGPDLFSASLLEATASGARAASAGVAEGGAIAVEGIASGARLAEGGLDLAGFVTDALARFAETETEVLGDVTTRAIGALERVTTDAPRVAAPPAAVGAAAFTPTSLAAPTPTPPTVMRDQELTVGAPDRAPTGVPTARAETVSAVDRELRERGVSAEEARAQVNVPALATAPGVKWTAADDAAIAAGRVPFAVLADGTVTYR